jgi:hypothetical protein
MNAEQPEPDDEEWLSREEIVTRDVERYRRENEAIQRWIAERCRLAVERWRAAHPWIADPNMCVTVPVRRLLPPCYEQ